MVASKKLPCREPLRAFLKKIGVDPKLVDYYDTEDEGGYTPKGKKEKYPKARKTEVQKLQQGWENWDNPLKQGLDYDTDTD